MHNHIKTNKILNFKRIIKSVRVEIKIKYDFICRIQLTIIKVSIPNILKGLKPKPKLKG